MAIEDINKAGGIMGRKIELIHLDPQGHTDRETMLPSHLTEKSQ